MQRCNLNLYFLLIILLSFGISAYGLHCSYFNKTECAASPENCHQEKTISCDTLNVNGSHSCFALWNSVNGSGEELLLKSCFVNAKDCDEHENCTARDYGRSNRRSGTTLFCCCSNDLCNRDYNWAPVPTTTPLPSGEGYSGPSHKQPINVLLYVMIPICCTIIAFGAFCFKRKLDKPLTTAVSQTNDEEKILLDKSDSSQTLSIKLLEVKAQGRFGKVWKASMAGHNSHVAVKILPFRERASWKLEQDIYSLPLMQDSEWILKYMCAREETDLAQLWLVTEFLDNGSLYDYLKGNIITWPELLRIAITMCNGLAFLHEELDGGGKGHKPAVAHRDFKSKNVLLRPDLTACVTDFGLAHIFYPNKPVGTCHGQVGTRRYMAPEVLEGAVSFTRDSFQRIDMYACGLVLWELASRCSVQQGPVGEYKLPFEEFTGQQPSLEEMQEVVVTQRKRPTTRNDWFAHSGLTVMAEAMKESWDQDAEARISASCIVERLKAINNKIV